MVIRGEGYKDYSQPQRIEDEAFRKGLFSVKNLTEEEKSRIVELYNQGHGLDYCSRKVIGNNNARLIKKILAENGIHIRNRNEAIQLLTQNQQHYIIDNNYFSNQSHNMAWVLGFLAADGSIRKNSNEIKITVARQDRDVLEKIQSELKTNHRIKDFLVGGKYPASTLQWTSKQHKRDLAKFSIIPQKTFKLKPPYALSKTYWIDYIRGYFDGDGSVNFIESNGKKHYTALRWQVCSATKDILIWIVNYLFDEYNIQKVNIQECKRKNHMYEIQYSTNSTKALYDVIYNDYLSMDRKRKHYKEIIEKISK